jgi:NIMA (never in mitosis gene a)-related kinase
MHRDLKCENVFLTDDNQLKLGDFGISKVLQRTNDKANTFVGTPYYLSPEILQGKVHTSTTFSLTRSAQTCGRLGSSSMRFVL